MYKTLIEIARIAYLLGHNDTVEGTFGDPKEVAEDLVNEFLADSDIVELLRTEPKLVII